MDYPRYKVKQSSFKSDRDKFQWNLWKQAGEGRLQRLLSAHETEADANAAAEADRAKGDLL